MTGHLFGGPRLAHSGGEITYAPIVSTTAGVPRYRLTVRLYRDPNGVVMGSATLVCNRYGCPGTTGSFSTVLPLPAAFVATNLSLGCPGSAVYRYELYTFSTEADLPRGQWTFSVVSENRVAGLRNLLNSDTNRCYISASLDNTVANQNTSPQFLSTLLPYLCGTQAQRYSFSAFDAEGDSLVYAFQYPQQGTQPALQCGEVIAGSALSPHFQLDAATGALTTQAGAVTQGLYNMVVRVSEYRRLNGSWQSIGAIMRDVSYLAYASANQSPSFTGLSLDGSTPQPIGQLIRVRPGQVVNLTFTAADPDAGQAMRFASQAPDIIAGMSLTTLSATQARLTWQVPATLPLGRYTATIAVLDNGCPLNASEERTVTFLATNQALATHTTLEAQAAAYPTPFREQVQFQAASGGQAVTVVDALGRTVACLRSEADGHVVWIPTPTLPAGLYLARGADGRALAHLLHSE